MNYVLRSRGKCRGTVLFIHGLGGHPYSTWRRGKIPVQQDESFWPTWLATGLPGIDVATISYDASPSGWFGHSMPLEDRATNIMAQLIAGDKLHETPIVFVCHSLGGILTKRLLLTLNEQREANADAARLFDAVRGVAFLASPHTGSGHASLIERLRALLWPSALTSALVAEASALRQYNMSYRAMINSQATDIRHLVLAEGRSTFFGKIVPESSADPGLPNVLPISVDADHFGVAKPIGKTDPIYRITLDFLKDCFVPTKAATSDKVSLNEIPQASALNVPALAARIVGLGLIAFVVFLAWKGFWLPKEPAYLAPLVAEAYKQENNSASTGLKPPEDTSLMLPEKTISSLASAKNERQINRALISLGGMNCNGSTEYSIRDGLLACSNGAPVVQLRTPNAGGEITELQALVFHFTASTNIDGDLQYMMVKNMGGSTHLLIARDGSIVQLAPFNRIAWHAGKSEWKERNLTNLNSSSIGVSFSNAGRLSKKEDGTFTTRAGTPIDSGMVYTDDKNGSVTYWQSYSDVQLAIAKGLILAFQKEFPKISFLGHSEIAPERKEDPGPAFQLDSLLTENATN